MNSVNGCRSRSSQPSEYIARVEQQIIDPRLPRFRLELQGEGYIHPVQEGFESGLLRLSGIA